jgi:hypothetical protein
MPTTNDITGDSLVSKKSNENYRDGWDRIFGKKAPEAKLPTKGPDENVCADCGKWKGAHAILPGQPTDSLCFCPRLVNGQWEGRPISDFKADQPEAFKEILKGIEDGTIQFS